MEQSLNLGKRVPGIKRAWNTLLFYCFPCRFIELEKPFDSLSSPNTVRAPGFMRMEAFLCGFWCHSELAVSGPQPHHCAGDQDRIRGLNS